MAIRFTDVVSPSIPDPASVQKAVSSIRKYKDRAGEYNKINEEFKKRTGVDIYEISDARGLVSKRMVTEGKERMSKGKAGAIPVYGDPLNQNTCAAGVCTIAANAGVNFGRMSGNLLSGLATDSKGRKIPQYNPLITSQLDKTGYYELAPNEKPQPGDLVQYFKPEGDAGVLTPYHLEFITDDIGDNKYMTFNNYGLFNTGEGQSGVRDVRGTNQTVDRRASANTRFYRLTPEASKAAAGEDNIKAIEASNQFKSELAALRQSGLEGENENVFGVLYSGVLNNRPKEKVMKDALSLAKNKDYVKSVIEELYK